MNSILSNKTARNYVGPDVEAMRAVAQAYSNRSLLEFGEVQQRYDFTHLLIVCVNAF